MVLQVWKQGNIIMSFFYGSFFLSEPEFLMTLIMLRVIILKADWQCSLEYPSYGSLFVYEHKCNQTLSVQCFITSSMPFIHMGEQNHRIVESKKGLGLKGPLKVIQLKPPAVSRDIFKQIKLLSLIQPGLGCSQGWGI